MIIPTILEFTLSFTCNHRRPKQYIPKQYIYLEEKLKPSFNTGWCDHNLWLWDTTVLHHKANLSIWYIIALYPTQFSYLYSKLCLIMAFLNSPLLPSSTHIPTSANRPINPFSEAFPIIEMKSSLRTDLKIYELPYLRDLEIKSTAFSKHRLFSVR